jgi:hypothetical protein
MLPHASVTGCIFLCDGGKKKKRLTKTLFHTNSQCPRQQQKHSLIFSNVHHVPSSQDHGPSLNEVSGAVGTYDNSSLEHLSKALLHADSANSRLTAISICFRHLDVAVVVTVVEKM